MTTSRILVVGRNDNIPRLGTYADRPIHLGSMTNEELLSYFRFTRNDITTTRLEEELAKRLADAVDELEAAEDEQGGTIKKLEEELEHWQGKAHQLEDDLADRDRQIEDIKDIINKETAQ